MLWGWGKPSGDSASEQASGNRDDTNDWSGEPRYSVDLLRRVVRVSLESVRIVAELSGLGVWKEIDSGTTLPMPLIVSWP